ncbi:MAG: flagellar biosynthesis anti-sigma factor FlgM [Phycisphaerae bacterium]|nr:flagellar biosynthesis anti-sigma factor FlgM [Phycisphaerae bacterium]
MYEIVSNSLSFLPPPTYPMRHLPPEARGTASPSEASGDRVEISSAGRELAESLDKSTFRQARVNAIRESIQAGTYETPERINGTAEKLLNVLG